VLNGLLGTDLSLSVMDYNALIKADLELFSFPDALATTANLEAASYDELLDCEVTGQQFLAALSQSDVSAGVRKALSRLMADGSQARPVALRRLFDLGPFGALTPASGSCAAAVPS
jgi:uncharacterized membrane protein